MRMIDPPPLSLPALIVGVLILAAGCIVALLAGVALARRADPAVRAHAAALLEGPGAILVCLGLVLLEGAGPATPVLLALAVVRLAMIDASIKAALAAAIAPAATAAWPKAVVGVFACGLAVTLAAAWMQAFALAAAAAVLGLAGALCAAHAPRHQASPGVFAGADWAGAAVLAFAGLIAFGHGAALPAAPLKLEGGGALWLAAVMVAGPGLVVAARALIGPGERRRPAQPDRVLSVAALVGLSGAFALAGGPAGAGGVAAGSCLGLAVVLGGAMAPTGLGVLAMAGLGLGLSFGAHLGLDNATKALGVAVLDAPALFAIGMALTVGATTAGLLGSMWTGPGHSP
jgi:multisubunit Na+/H+ antiporter MnhG subunit